MNYFALISLFVSTSCAMELDVGSDSRLSDGSEVYSCETFLENNIDNRSIDIYEKFSALDKVYDANNVLRELNGENHSTQTRYKRTKLAEVSKEDVASYFLDWHFESIGETFDNISLNLSLIHI